MDTFYRSNGADWLDSFKKSEQHEVKLAGLWENPSWYRAKGKGQEGIPRSAPISVSNAGDISPQYAVSGIKDFGSFQTVVCSHRSSRLRPMLQPAFCDD